MRTLPSRLRNLIENIVPHVEGTLEVADRDLRLTQLGFDSMAMIALFCELESEYRLSLDELSCYLTSRCTLAGLLELCEAAQAA